MKTLLVFGSLLGKTKRLSILIGHLLRQSNIDITVKAVQNTRVSELNKYDVVILGCSTWDDGMLQFDFREFNDELVLQDFPDKKFCVFGVGGKKYPHFCASVDILESSVKRVHGSSMIPSLRLDIDHDEPADKMDKEVIAWTAQLTQLIEQHSKTLQGTVR
jgi:flavodoxin I